MIHEPDAQRFLGSDHFAGQAQLVRHAFAAQASEPLRTAVTRQNPQLHFRLPQLGVFAGDSNRATQCQLASAAESESVDGANGWLAHRFQKMKNTLAKKRKLFSIYRCLLGEFADVRSGN